MAKFIGAILNSSMFFFWFTTFSNNRNVAGIDVRGFPLGNPTKQILEQVGILFDELMKDYERKSEILDRKDVKLQVFYPSLSKPIMDDIDRAISKHFGFSGEELDFIINYDIKYRMGKDAGEEEGEWPIP